MAAVSIERGRRCDLMGLKGIALKSLVCLTIFLVAIGSSTVLQAQKIDSADRIAQLRTIKGRMIERSINTRSRSAVLEAGGRDAQVTQLLATTNGWWSAYSEVKHPHISFNGAAWHTPALLARAWADPSSRYYHSKEVLTSIEQGLKYLQRFAYPGCPRPNNWWAWDIGMPMGVLETLILTEGSLDASIRQQAIDTVAYLHKCGQDLKSSLPAKLPLSDTPGKNDMNALWRWRLRLQMAVLIENPAMAGKWAQYAMSEIGRPGYGCLQADYSYKFHGGTPMWAYGRTFLADYGDIVEVYHGTVLAPNAEQLDRFAEMALHYVNGFLYRGSICPAIIGREITRGDDMYHGSYGPPAVRALTALVRAKHPRSSEFLRIIAREREYFKDVPSIAAEQAWLTNDLPVVKPAPPVDDIFAYPDSDFLQITRPNWAIGIKMHSIRNRGYESINGENLQGWFLSHGSMFHFIGGNEWKGCWPTIDWTRLPGTTVAVSDKSQNQSPFVGVLRASPRNAIAAMNIQTKGLQTRKSWFVDGQVVICLGSDISGAGRIETALFNQPVPANTLIVVDGKTMASDAFEKDVAPEWIWLGGMGYVFPPGQCVHVLREKRSSDWTSVREAWRHGAGERSSIWYLTGVIRHSENVRAYCYIMLSHVTAEQMPGLARGALARYKYDSGSAHRVTAGDWEACVFWEPGRAGKLSADGGCIVWRDAAKWMAVDPARTGRPLHIDIEGHEFAVVSDKGRPASGDQMSSSHN